jgi:alanine racemase
VRVDTDHLRHNYRLFAARVGPARAVMPIVKSNAYGHGVDLVVETLLDEGVRWFGVNGAEEALHVRRLARDARILVLGYVPPGSFPVLVREGIDFVLTNPEEIELADGAAAELGRPARVHLKVETGTHRRGVSPDEFASVADRARRCTSIEWVGLATHFANIEDTVNHSYAELQLERFRDADRVLSELGLRFTHRHTACTAAALLFPETHFDLARVGIGLYGLWPSRETRLSLRFAAADPAELRPCLSWVTEIIQVKNVGAGEYVGYGRTYRTTSESRIAVLPIGYAEGYDRHLSNAAHVIVRGKRAPVRGRVCMNMTIIDVTHVPGAAVGDGVTLIGKQGDEEIHAEDLASWAETINYEIVSRIHPSIPRRAVREARSPLPPRRRV